MKTTKLTPAQVWFNLAKKSNLSWRQIWRGCKGRLPFSIASLQDFGGVVSQSGLTGSK